MMERVEHGWKCKICSYRTNNKFNLNNHIESNHIEGASYPCKECGGNYKTMNSLTIHMAKSHYNNIIK